MAEGQSSHQARREGGREGGTHTPNPLENLQRTSPCYKKPLTPGCRIVTDAPVCLPHTRQARCGLHMLGGMKGGEAYRGGASYDSLSCGSLAGLECGWPSLNWSATGRWHVLMAECALG